VGDVPADLFRMGGGRADPEPALEAFGAFLSQRAVAAPLGRARMNGGH
jgi:hypothetical protein